MDLLSADTSSKWRIPVWIIGPPKEPIISATNNNNLYLKPRTLLNRHWCRASKVGSPPKEWIMSILCKLSVFLSNCNCSLCLCTVDGGPNPPVFVPSAWNECASQIKMSKCSCGGKKANPGVFLLPCWLQPLDSSSIPAGVTHSCKGANAVKSVPSAPAARP